MSTGCRQGSFLAVRLGIRKALWALEAGAQAYSRMVKTMVTETGAHYSLSFNHPTSRAGVGNVRPANITHLTK